MQNYTTLKLILIFVLILSFGCSNTPVVVNKDDRLIKAAWNKLPPRFSHRENNDSLVVHPFFDVDPKLENLANAHSVNFALNYVVTNKNSTKYQYELDLYSGKLYKERDYCAQDDIWKSYSGDLLYPNFTQGIIPRVYDEAKKPMRVFVLSKDNFIEPFKESPTHFDRVVIMGSLVVEECESYPCDLKSKWKPRQILFGVSDGDRDNVNVANFMELKKRVDWKYLRSMIGNMYGYHHMGNRPYAAYRITRELNLADTVDYFKKTSSSLDQKAMEALATKRTACFSLYDAIWDKTESIRKTKGAQDEMFLNYFRELYGSKKQELYECQEIARPSSITDNTRRHWFFSYIQAFILLVENGYYYDCNNEAWFYNPKVSDAKFYVDQVKELNRCRAKSFEKSFDQAINGMSTMNSNSNKYYRYVEYDYPRGGSHQKIYGWILNKHQNYQCKYDTQATKQNSFDIFPQDVAWESFTQEIPKTVR